MEVLTVAVAALMRYVCDNLPSDTTDSFLPSLCNRGNIATNLGPRLSTGATISFPGSTNFDIATTRWSALDSPNITVVVEVTNEDDVAETVLVIHLIARSKLIITR